jgi:hypothetical protein
VPSMGMCPDEGLLLLASSVHRKVGYMYRQYKRLHGNDEAEGELCWFAPSTVMNPRLPASVIDGALAGDKSKASAEFLNIWREDIADFLPIDVIEACTDWGVHERPSVAGIYYFAFTDAAGGTGKDSFTLAIAHVDGDKIVIDLIRERQPRFVAADVIKEYADLLRSYGIGTVMSDNWGGGLHADEWVRNRIEFRKCPYDKSENYLRSLPLLMAKRGLLLDHAKQRLQLAGLERRVSGGHETIGHAQTASAHDDISDAVCGVLVAANRAQQEPPIVMPFFHGKNTGDIGHGVDLAPAPAPEPTPQTSPTPSWPPPPNSPPQPTPKHLLKTDEANATPPPAHYLKDGQRAEPWAGYGGDGGAPPSIWDSKWSPPRGW